MTLGKDGSGSPLTISGNLEIDHASELREAILECLRNEPELVVDLGSVAASDTAALQVLLSGFKTAASLQKTLRIVALSEQVAQTAKALGLPLPSVTTGAGDGSRHAA